MLCGRLRKKKESDKFILIFKPKWSNTEMMGPLQKTPSQTQDSVSTPPTKVRSDFKSTEDYFQHLASDVSDLEKTLALPGGDKVLDEVDETGNTLLHWVAEDTSREFTFAVEPYLTDKRVAAQNQKGNTVLHNHIKFIGNKECWQQTMGVYLKHANGGATLSIQNNAGDTALARFYMYKPWDPDGQRPSVTNMLLREGLPNLDFNAPCASGMQVLTLAIGGNKFDDAITLLDHGASPVFHGVDKEFSAEYALNIKKQQFSQEIAKDRLILSNNKSDLDGYAPAHYVQDQAQEQRLQAIAKMQETELHKDIEIYQGAFEKLNLIEQKIRDFQ
jgi:hypothetical protein